MRSIKLIGTIAVALLIPMTLTRLLLLLRYDQVASAVPGMTIAKAFVVGLRFDLSTIGYILVPVALLAVIPIGWLNRSVFLKWLWSIYLCLMFFVVLVVGAVDSELFGFFNIRINHLVLQWLSTPKVVFDAISGGFAFYRTLIVLLVLTGLFGWVVVRSFRSLAYSAQQKATWKDWVAYPVILIIMFIAIRGGFSNYPLRFDYANFSTHYFANQLALNPLYNLLEDVMAMQDVNSADPRFTDIETAHRKVQQVLNISEEEITTSPLTRQITSDTPARPVNVVVILMESLNNEFIKGVGGQYDLAPCFDSLSTGGLLFNNFYSNGAHTQHGVFSTLTGLSVPPGQAILHRPSIVRPFPGIGLLLKERGYSTAFYCTHDPLFDHLAPFILVNGFDRFYGLWDYQWERRYTWGVADEVMFDHALVNFGQMQEPFLGVLLTCSSHHPFDHPTDRPYRHTELSNDHHERFNSFTYADWALNQFYRQAMETDWGKNTVFVITGDHGINWFPKLELDLIMFKVPLLFLGPGIQPAVNNRLGSQKDILPTLFNMLGGDYTNATLGVNLRDDKTTPHAVVGEEALLGYIKGDYYVYQNRSGDVSLYRLDDLSQLANSPDIRDSLITEARSFLTLSHEIVTRGVKGRPLEK